MGLISHGREDTKDKWGGQGNREITPGLLRVAQAPAAGKILLTAWRDLIHYPGTWK